MNDKKGEWKSKLLRVLHLLELLVGVLAAVSTEYVFHLFGQISPKLRGFVHVWWLSLLGTIIVLLVGVGLFFFRKYRQREYGLVEIGFALAVGWSGIMKVQSANDISSWITVVAGAYL